MIFVVFLLLAMRLNFFMDVITAMAFSYIVYSLIYSRKDSIDSFLLNPKQKINEWVNRNKDDISTVNNDWHIHRVILFLILIFFWSLFDANLHFSRNKLTLHFCFKL